MEINMQKQSLNGVWTMHPVCTPDSAYMQTYQLADSYPVKVPGSVLSALLDAGAIPDPYDRENEYSARELFWQDYSFD